MALLSFVFSAPCTQAADRPEPHRAGPFSPIADTAFESYVAHVAAAEASFRLGEVSEARRWLETAPREHRGWEWRHLTARLDESLAHFDSGGESVVSLAVSPDGFTVAAGDAEGVVRLLSTSSGTQRAALTGHTAAIHDVRFNAAGNRLVSASADGTVRVWDLTTHDTVRVFDTHHGPAMSAAFSPDGTRVASCGYERLEIEGNPRTQGRAFIWNAETAQVDIALTGGVSPLRSIRFAPDGACVLAGSGGGSVFVWDLAPRADRIPLALALPVGGAHDVVNSIDVSRHGSWVAGGLADRTARVWNLPSGALVATLHDHNGGVHSVAFSPDGRYLATAAHDDVVRLWDVSTWRLHARLLGHRAPVYSLAWSLRGNRLYSGGADGSIRVWDSSYTGYGAAIHMRHSAACHAACFSPSGDRLYTCGANGSVNVWDAYSGRRVAFWDAHPGASCDTIDLASDGRYFASCSSDQTVRVWNVATSKEVARFELAHGARDVAMSPDSGTVAIAHGHTITLRDVATGATVRRFAGHEAGVADVTYSGDGALLASGSFDKTARVWHVATGLPLATMRGHEGSVNAVAFDRTGSLLATGSADGAVKLWSSRSGRLMRTLYAGDDPIRHLAFSPDGKRIAVASRQLVLLDVQHGVAVVKFKPHDDAVWNLQFSPDGRRLVSCSRDSTIVILDTRSFRARMGLPIRVKSDD